MILLLGALMTLNAKTGYKLPADEIVKIYDTQRRVPRIPLELDYIM